MLSLKRIQSPPTILTIYDEHLYELPQYEVIETRVMNEANKLNNYNKRNRVFNQWRRNESS